MVPRWLARPCKVEVGSLMPQSQITFWSCFKVARAWERFLQILLSPWCKHSWGFVKTSCETFLSVVSKCDSLLLLHSSQRVAMRGWSSPRAGKTTPSRIPGQGLTPWRSRTLLSAALVSTGVPCRSWEGSATSVALWLWKWQVSSLGFSSHRLGVCFLCTPKSLLFQNLTLQLRKTSWLETKSSEGQHDFFFSMWLNLCIDFCLTFAGTKARNDKHCHSGPGSALQLDFPHVPCLRTKLIIFTSQDHERSLKSQPAYALCSLLLPPHTKTLHPFQHPALCHGLLVFVTHCPLAIKWME